MAQDTITTQPVTPISQTAARLSLAGAAMFVVLRSQLRTIWGRIGLALLLVSAAGLAIAGIFTTDPIMASKDAVTSEGKLHNLGGTLGIAMPYAAAIIGWSLARNQAWSSARKPLIWATALALLSFVVSFSSLTVMLSQRWLGGQMDLGKLLLLRWEGVAPMFSFHGRWHPQAYAYGKK